MSGAEREGFGTVREHRTHIIYPDQEGPRGRNPISFTKIWGGGGNRDGFGMVSGRFGDIEPISFTPIWRAPAGETPYHLPQSWRKSLHSGPPKRRKSHVLSRIFATFGLKKHKTHITGPDLEGPPAQIPYCCIADLVGTSVGPECDDAACRSDPTFTRASPGLAVAEQLPQINEY